MFHRQFRFSRLRHRRWLDRRKSGYVTKVCERILRQLIIPALALLAFSVAYHFCPRILKHRNHLESWDPDEIDRIPKTDHPPYITDEITDFIINAEGCPVQEVTAKPDSQSQHSGAGQPHHTKQKTSSINDSHHSDMNGVDMSSHWQPLDALFIVCSDVKKDRNRKYFRDLYATYNSTRPYNIKVVFLVGMPDTPEGLTLITEEAHNYSDIVMGNFMDHYDNLTYKTVMGYRWVITHCRGVDRVLKMDDDVFLDVYKFFNYFRTKIGYQTRTIHCYLNRFPKVSRYGKYHVTKKEYQDAYYPDFCSGFFIVPSMDIVEQFYAIAKNTKFFRMEDVYSYGIVREAMVDVQLIHLDLVTVDHMTFTKCFFDFKYACKYMAAHVNPFLLPSFQREMENYRTLLRMTGENFLDLN